MINNNLKLYSQLKSISELFMLQNENINIVIDKEKTNHSILQKNDSLLLDLKKIDSEESSIGYTDGSLIYLISKKGELNIQNNLGTIISFSKDENGVIFPNVAKYSETYTKTGNYQSLKDRLSWYENSEKRIEEVKDFFNNNVDNIIYNQKNKNLSNNKSFSPS